MALLNLIVTLTLLFVTIESKEELNLDDASAVVGEKFDYQIGNEVFLSTYKIYRIVQRGQRKLPSWLTFDTNSSMLIGYPKKDDVGMYTLRMRAQCIDPKVSNCQDKLSRSFHITVIEPLISAESRGRKKSFSKHGKEKWRLTNMHNGNAGLYVEYDISRHGTVVEKKPGMLDSGSEHVLSNGALYSAMQFDNVAKYFSNKNTHDKLSSYSYLVMHHNSASINFLSLSDVREQFPSIVTNYPSIHHHSFVHSLNNDMLSFSSSVFMYSSYSMHFNARFDSVQYSDMPLQTIAPYNSRSASVQYSDRPLQTIVPYNSRSASVHYSDKFSPQSSQLFSSMQLSISLNNIHNSEMHEISPTGTDVLYKPSIFHTRTIGAKASEDLLFTKHSVIDNKKVDKEKSEDSVSSDADMKKDLVSKSSQNTKSSDYGVSNLCSKDQTVFYASLILHVIGSLTSAQEYILIQKWSNFVSKDPVKISISRTESDEMGFRYNGKYILTAGPGNVIESLSKSVELSWHIACDVFDHVEDFTRVIQHNIDIGRVNEEIGFDVIAWFVYTDRPLSKRVRRQAHSRQRQTATPTYSPPVPTTLSELFSATVTDSSTLSSSLSLSSETLPLSSSLSTSLSLSSETLTHFISSSSSFGLFPTSAFSVTSTTQSISFSSPSLRSSQFSRSLKISDSSSQYFETPKLTSSLTISTSLSSVFSSTLSFLDFSSLSVPTSLISQLFPGSVSSLPLIILSSSELSPAFSPTQESSSSAVVPLSTSSYSPFLDTMISSSITKYFNISTLASVYSSSSFIPSLFTSSFITPFSTSKVLTYSRSLSEIESSTLSEISMTSFTLSELFPSSLTFGLPLSTYSSSLSTSLNIASQSEEIISSSPLDTFRSTFEPSMSLTSFLYSTPISSSFSVFTAKPSNFSSQISSVSLETTISQISPFLSSISVLISSSESRKDSVTSMFTIPSTITTFKTSLPASSLSSFSSLMLSSEYISISATSVVSSAITSTDFTTSSRSTVSSAISSTSSRPVIISPVQRTTLSPSLSSALLSESSKYSKDFLSSAFTSSVSEETRLLSSSVIVSATDVLSSTISSLPSSSSEAFERSSVSELKPSLSELTSSGSFSASFSTMSLTTGRSTTAVLTTIPSTSLEASVISPNASTTFISPTRVSETFSLTSLPSTRVVPTAAPNESPKLEKSIDHLNVIVGRYFEYQVPEDTFLDKEDGNTRNLTLRLSLTYSKAFPKGAWLMFNETSQTFYGIPLRNDSDGAKKISEFTLIARDSKGEVAKDAISLTYEYEKNINHEINMILNGSYEKFTEDREQLIQVARNIGDFYGDEKLNFLSFSGVEKGSVVISWSNNSLTGTSYQKGVIKDLYDRLADENGTISDQFLALFRDYIPVNISLEYLGVCLLPITSHAPPTKAPVTETDNKMWIEIVLPALIAILVIVIIALLLLICCRHRRPSKEIKDSDKPAFLEDRRPIIFPDELEMVDPSLKPKTPLVLPSDYLSETPPAVPPHGRQAPPYRTAMLDDDEDQPFSPSYRGEPQGTEPPPYRLPPPYFNPHRIA